MSKLMSKINLTGLSEVSGKTGGFSLMNNKFMNGIGTIISENASTITMVGAVVTLGLTLWEAFKASEEVAAVKAKSEEAIAKAAANKPVEVTEDDTDEDAEGSTGIAVLSEEAVAQQIKEIKAGRNFRYIYAYKWALMFGVLSAVLMILTKWIDGMTIAGLTALGVKYQDQLKSFMNHTKETVGEEKFQEIKDKTLEEKVLKNFFGEDGPQARKFSPRLGNRLWVDTEEGLVFQMDLKDVQDTLDHAEEYYRQNEKYGLGQSKYLEMFGFSKEEIRRQTGQNRFVEKWWGPNAPFKPSIGTATIMGASFPSIQFAYQPTSAERAGISCAKKLLG